MGIAEASGLNIYPKQWCIMAKEVQFGKIAGVPNSSDTDIWRPKVNTEGNT